MKVFLGLLALTVPALSSLGFQRDPLAVPAAAKFTVSLESYPGMVSPNPRGWYHHVANVVTARDGSLVACYRLADSHTLLRSDIMIAFSKDGKTWTGHRSIAHSDVWVEHAVWIAPQLSVLQDGRLVIVCDLGERTAGQNQPMLTDWQKPERGMANYLFWSEDNGHTWTKPQKIDAVGGEPGYIFEQSDGTLAFTRTSSQRTALLRNPPPPWNDIYYRNEIVFSRDHGRTWPESRWLADSPFHGDCEVGLAELASNRLIAATRVGLGNGMFGNPSRLVLSDDGGKTWPHDEPAPFYGQRPHLGRLKSGKYLVTYRNVWGTPGSRALVFDPAEHSGFQPTSYILDETRCELLPDELALRTGGGKRAAVEFNLQPVQDDRSRVEIETSLRVESADLDGCAISAGCWVRFLPDRICLADRPSAGFDFDTRGWHHYRIVRQNDRITISADGQQRLEAPIDDIWVREVRFGNRGGGAFAHTAAVTHWRDFSARVDNADDDSINWRWKPQNGYPDQFRRDRMVTLDTSYAADCGYSGWTQRPDGQIVILDYTNGGSLESFVWGGVGEGNPPFVRSYVVTEAMLTRAGR